MQVIPLIEIINKKIQNFELLDKLNQDDLLYIIDLDAIEKDDSNLDIYQTLSKKYQLWVDAAPRTLGDAVDIFMAGAENITLRKTFYPQANLESIREFTENKIYANIEIYDDAEFYDDFFFEDVDGLINFYSRDEIEKDFIINDAIKNFSTKNKINIYENNKQNIEYWNKFNPECFLVDISKYQEFTQI